MKKCTECGRRMSTYDIERLLFCRPCREKIDERRRARDRRLDWNRAERERLMVLEGYDRAAKIPVVNFL